jgi:hypothetical protein
MGMGEVLVVVLVLAAICFIALFIRLVLWGQRAGTRSAQLPAEQRISTGHALAATQSAGGISYEVEQHVRDHRFQPGVIANGQTLIDLYDRINALEARVAELERGRA